ncbi:hypothetical protein SLS59_009983 [Nothophoma quercina]|uniref:Uncharacterized protein n=1 Tax=Nothophoma quercina TaxID=749835 RepID=A0ABR3QIW9_9PLEO
MASARRRALGFQFKNPFLTDPTPLSATSPAPQPLLQQAPGFERLPAPPSFLVINLFTLRLAFKLIQGLDYYAERFEDLNWIAKFLEIYHPGYDLAKLTGERWRKYLAKYPDIVRRMKRQKREVIRKRGGMTDNDRIEIANFVEAAHEWGSTVLVPKSEFGRMKVLTSGRLVADDKREPTDLDPRRAPPREPDPSLKEIVNNPGLYHV